MWPRPLRVTRGASCVVALGALVACAGTSTDGNGGNGGLIDIPTTRVRAPAAQGAGVFTLRSASPAPAGKSCPAGATSTVGVPNVTGTEALDENTYQHKIVDGEEAAQVLCKVAGTTSFSFEGVLRLGPRSLQIKNGVLDPNRTGTADITLSDATLLPGALASAGPCAINAGMGGSSTFQVKPGSMWAGFNCASVVAAPSDYCLASGVFVLENCER